MADRGEAIRDFFVKLGFDGTEVIKGLAAIDKEFSKFNKKLVNSTKTQNKMASDSSRMMTAAARVNSINAKVDMQRLNIAKEAAKVAEHQERLRMRHVRREDALLARRVATQNALDKTGRRTVGVSVNPQLAGEASTLNARREMLQREISTARTTSEFAKLRAAISRLNDDTTRFISNNRQMQKQLTASAFSAKALKDSLNNLARSYVSVFAVIGGGAAFVRTGQELVAMRATLLGVSGDAKTAAEDFEFVKETSLALGVSVTEATSAYAKLGAAAKAAGISTEDGKEAFLAAAELATAFQLSEADFQGVSRAMSQIASKGKLSTELWYAH